MHDREHEGADVSFYAARLAEVADPRVKVKLVSTGAVQNGAETVAAEVNAVWGTTFTAATVRAALGSGLPPAP